MKKVLVLLVVVGVAVGGYVLFKKNPEKFEELKQKASALKEGVTEKATETVQEVTKPGPGPEPAKLPFITTSQLASLSTPLGSELLGVEIFVRDGAQTPAKVALSSGAALDLSGATGTGLQTISVTGATQGVAQGKAAATAEDVSKLALEGWRANDIVQAALQKSPLQEDRSVQPDLWATKFKESSDSYNGQIIIEGVYAAARQSRKKKGQDSVTLKGVRGAKFQFPSGGFAGTIGDAIRYHKEHKDGPVLKMLIQLDKTPKYQVGSMQINMSAENQFKHWVSVFKRLDNSLMLVGLSQWAHDRGLSDESEIALQEAQGILSRDKLPTHFGQPASVVRVHTADGVQEHWFYTYDISLRREVTTTLAVGQVTRTQHFYVKLSSMELVLDMKKDSTSGIINRMN